jgi:uncharacterized membrane protein YraQ (UPF0718 family)
MRLWLLAALGVCAAAFPATTVATLRFVAVNLAVMAPVIGVAVLLSAGLRASGADGLLARLFQGRPLRMILAAALFGAVTPICGVGVLPIIAGLLGAGLPLAPVMAFWLASPITDPAMLAITTAMLGPAFAVGKTTIAAAVGVAGGLATQALAHRRFLHRPLRMRAVQAEACGPTAVLWRFWRDAARRRVFLQQAGRAALLMVTWLGVAFALESLLRGHLAPEALAAFVGTGNAWAIPIAVTVGLPVYLDGYAALPLVRGLLALGMAPGAAMAFLVAGGITSLYASLAVFALVRWPVFLWYLGLAVAGSALGGYAYGAYCALAASAL